MASVMNKMNEWEQKYYDVSELYTLSDELLATVETSANPETQLGLVAPLVEVIGESAELLGEDYITLCEGKKDRKAAKSRIEGALRKIYVAMNEFSVKARDGKNAAYAIVKKIKRQLEQVIVNFLEFTVISLDRVMQKHDVEEMKQRHASIAMMLHQQGLQGA